MLDMSTPVPTAPPSSSSARYSLPAVVLAALLPLLVIGLPLARWSVPDPTASKGDLATRLERAVENDPDVVVLGASKVGTDLDLPLLARELGLPPEQVAGVHLSGTTAPVWYAVLDNRVFGTGKTPKLVIVYSTFDWTLATLPSGESERTVLASQLDGDDPVLQRKTLGDDGNATLTRIRLHRTETHATLMAWIRDASVGALLAKPAAGQSLAQAGGELAAPALERLFGLGAAIDASQISRAIPIVEAARATIAITAKRVEDTLLPDFVALASEQGARIVFVSAPVRRQVEIAIDYPPATARAAVSLLNGAGAGYTDLRDLALPDSAFGDATHLNKGGRDTLTRALVGRLKAMNAMNWMNEGEKAGIVPAKLPVVQAMPTATRTGNAPALPKLEPKRGGGNCDWSAVVPGFNAISDSDLEVAGFGMVSPLRVTEDGVLLAPNATRDEFAFRCGGASQHQGGLVKFAPTEGPAEAAAARSYALALAEEIPVRSRYGFGGWWVYPGTTLRLDFSEGWKSDAADPGFGVTLEALALAAPAQPGTVTMRVADSAAAPLSQDGLHRSGAASIAPPSGAWSITIDAPADAGWVFIQRLRIGNAADTRVIIGQDGPTAIPALAASASYIGADGKPDAPLLPAAGAFTPQDGNVAKADVAMLGVPDTDALWKVSSVAGCSPLRVSEDGVLLKNPLVRAQDVVGNGAYAQVGQTLYALGSDGSSPAQNGRAYTIALDPSRACRGLRWVYPGDTLTLKLTPNLVSRLLGGAQRLEIGSAAVVPDGASPEARVVVKVGTEVRLDTRFKLGMPAPPSWTFDPPLPRGPDPVYVEISLAADAPYLLLSSVALSEPGAPAPGPAPTDTHAAPTGAGQ